MNRLLPEVITNSYPGPVAGIWLFVPVLLLKFGPAFVHLFKSDGGAQSIAMIPLDTYPAGAAQNVVGLFARMGVEQLTLAALFLLVLVRYRSLIPLLYLLIVLSFVGMRLIGELKPLVRTGTSGASTPALLVAIAGLIGLGLSLFGRPR